MTEEQQAAAIIAAINAAMPTGVKAYDFDEVPTTLPAKYVVIDVSRRYVAERRASGEVTVPGGRLGTRYVAQSVSDARELRRRTVAALEDKALPVGAEFVGPFVFETADPIVPDEGWHSGADTWTF